MASQAQFDEQARQDRLGAARPSPLGSMATPAQRSEKRRQDPTEYSHPLGAAPSAQLTEKGRPPPLPPRTSSTASALTAPPPPYTTNDARRSEWISEQWRSRDPRSSSTHSLVPPESERDGRRTLLLIFIHGFLGSETSFQSFPAHVHNLLTITLSQTHVVHTKIYPRYKSRKAIDFARDDFSYWLSQNETQYTEVILLGHSMGGILAAEVTLQRPITPATGQPFRHRILGTINFDTPFLGMHPGVVLSGIGSLFRPAPDPPGTQFRSGSGANTPSLEGQASASTPSYGGSIAESHTSSQVSLVQNITSPQAKPTADDPFFNPPFANDVRIVDRKGWTNIMHFINKHSDGLTSATKDYFISHLEFGGCLADYPGLKSRYEKIRSLEDVDENRQRNGPGYRPPTRRVRFVNYYTASTGRLKAPKPPKIPEGQMLGQDGLLKPIEVEMQDMALGGPRSGPLTPKILVEEHNDGAVTPQPLEEPDHSFPAETLIKDIGQDSAVQNDFQEPPEMRHVDSIPIEDDDFSEPPSEPITAATSVQGSEPFSELQSVASEVSLPPIPPVPVEPEIIDLGVYTDKDSRKIAEKEQKRVLKAYQHAVKDRENAIKDRKKLVEKREKKARQEQERQQKANGKQRLKEEKEEEKRKASILQEPRARQESSVSSAKEVKPKRDKKFCMLPPERGGKRDACWIRVYMEGVDEVGAHCGLFFPGPHYESLVGDVGERISQWVEEDATRRAVADAER